MEPTDSLLEFPCRFPVKAMGSNEPGFEQLVVEACRIHAGPVQPADIQTKVSRNGRYLSVTVTIDASSRAQLDAIYQTLSASEHVLFLL